MSSKPRDISLPEFARRVLTKRKENRWSQRELADRAGLTRSKIKGYELAASYPTVPGLVRLADALDVSIEWLLTGVGPELKETEGVDHSLQTEHCLIPYIDLVTDMKLLRRIKPTAYELEQLLHACQSGIVGDHVELMGLLNTIRGGNKLED